MVTWEVAVGFWFVVSVVLEFLGTVVLRLWLAYQGVEFPFLKAGMPFYIDRRYREWAEKTGRSPKWVLGIRTFSTLNMVIASVVFVVMSAGQSPHQK